MIEVEKKFLLTQQEVGRLADGATFVGEKKIVDAYYDDASYTYSLGDHWLRKRGDVFELKAPLSAGSGEKGGTNQYREITDHDEIRKALKITPTGRGLEKDLEVVGVEPFCVCIANRTAYKKDGFNIDVDHASYEGTDFTFDVVEVETVVDDESEVQLAHDQIVAFADKHQLDAHKQVVGKIPAYLEHEKPEHYAALVAVGVI